MGAQHEIHNLKGRIYMMLEQELNGELHKFYPLNTTKKSLKHFTDTVAIPRSCLDMLEV